MATTDVSKPVITECSKVCLSPPSTDYCLASVTLVKASN